MDSGGHTADGVEWGCCRHRPRVLFPVHPGVECVWGHRSLEACAFRNKQTEHALAPAKHGQIYLLGGYIGVASRALKLEEQPAKGCNVVSKFVASIRSHRYGVDL